MTAYLALLRGVNVGGVTVKMAELAEVVRRLGTASTPYDGVKTVLASGNVLFETADAASVVKDRLESALRSAFGYDAWVHVLTVDKLRKIVAAYPLERSAERHAYVVFVLKPEVQAELLAVELDPAVEQAEAGDGVVYWSVPKGSTLDSALGKAQSAARHKPWLTTRNLNTLEKLTR
ncbi:MAG TPA: DUF1697 domain-containing protein [Pseudolysinimonas sp.]|nr:DUF1697 domain-containing protein [Pseudolysinimonas sp.]